MLNQRPPYNASAHSGPARSYRPPVPSPGGRTASFAPPAFPTLALFHQRLLNRMAYAFRKCPTFNRWSPCSASLLSALAVSCRHQCPSLVDAQRLSLLGSFLHRLSSTSGYLIEWLMPFASYPAFNQWLPCSVSPHSDQARWCKHLCSGTVDAQRLSCLGYCLRNSLLLVTGFDWM